MKSNLGLIIAGIAAIIVAFVVLSKPKAIASGGQTTTPPAPTTGTGATVSGASDGQTLDGGSVKVVASDTTVTVAGAGEASGTQSLQAAAQLTGQTIVSSASVQDFTGGSVIPRTINVLPTSDLYPIVTSRFVDKLTNTIQAGAGIGWTPTGERVIAISAVADVTDYQKINGSWYSPQTFRFGQRIRYNPVPIVDLESLTLSYPPSVPDVNN